MSIVLAELEGLRGKRQVSRMTWIAFSTKLRSCFQFSSLSRMGLAISLVATEKEKVGLILHICLFCYSCIFWGSLFEKQKQTLTVVQTGVVSRLCESWQRLLQHPAEGGRRLYHLVQ